MIPVRLPRRRGFGLIEMAVSGVLFAAMVVLTIQLVGWVALDRQANLRRESAIRQVSNVMERALGRPWSDLSNEGLAPLAAVVNESKAVAPGRLTIVVIAEPPVDGLGQKKLVVAVEWPDRTKVAEAPVRLIAWAYERKGTQP